ncbi:hypothetical protein QOT17_012407 [Balamuthia mandrillaris]
MCAARLCSAIPPDVLQQSFSVQERWPDKRLYSPSFSLGGGNVVAVMTLDKQQQKRRKLRSMVWGFRPSWLGQGGKLVRHARAETLKAKATFKDLLPRNRCVVLCEGFYLCNFGEKKAFYYQLPPSENGTPRVMALAALFTPNTTSGASTDSPIPATKYSVVVISVPTAPKLAKIHPRMPAVLNHVVINIWLNCKFQVDTALGLLQPYDGLLCCGTTSILQKVYVDSPELLQSFGEAGDDHVNSQLGQRESGSPKRILPPNQSEEEEEEEDEQEDAVVMPNVVALGKRKQPDYYQHRYQA